MVVPNDIPPSTPIPEDLHKAKSLLNFSVHLNGLRVYIDEERSQILTSDLHRQAIKSSPISSLVKHPELDWRDTTGSPMARGELHNDDEDDGHPQHDDQEVDQNDQQSKGWMHSIRTSWVGRFFGVSLEEKTEQDDEDGDQSADGNDDSEIGIGSSDGTQLDNNRDLMNHIPPDRSNRSTTDWGENASDDRTTGEEEYFDIDGRVSFSEFVRPFCHVMVFDEENEIWVKEENDDEVNESKEMLNEQSKQTKNNNEKVPFIAKLISEKLKVLAKSKAKDSNQSTKEPDSLSKSKPIDRPKKNMIPSLYVNKTHLDEFNKMLTATFNSFHDFITPSTDITIDLFIAAIPIRVKDPPSQLVFSDFNLVGDKNVEKY